jgi:bifunctional non-homologous end joining protein LigD
MYHGYWIARSSPATAMGYKRWRQAGWRDRAPVHPPRHDSTDRYPAIASAAAKLRARSFTLDCEAVVAGADGLAVFDALHRRGRVTDAILQAFDLLKLDGEDLRPMPLGKRKPRLARLLARAPAGITLNEHTDEDGAVVFLHACKMGLEGIVSSD